MFLISGIIIPFYCQFNFDINRSFHFILQLQRFSYRCLCVHCTLGFKWLISVAQLHCFVSRFPVPLHSASYGKTSMQFYKAEIDVRTKDGRVLSFVSATYTILKAILPIDAWIKNKQWEDHCLSEEKNAK